MPQSRARMVLLGTVTVGLAIAGSAIVAEAVLRVFPHAATTAGATQYEFHVEGSLYEFGYQAINVRLRPSAIASVETPEYRAQTFVNSLGFNDYEFPLKKPPNTYRIALVGDSLTYGAGVDMDATFAKVLERRFAADPPLPGRRIEVLNLGCGSWSAGQNYLAIRDLALPLSPDLVVLVHFANDAMEWPFYPDESGLPRTYVVTPDYWNQMRPEVKPQVPAKAPNLPGWLEAGARRSRVAALIADAVRSYAARGMNLGTADYPIGDERLDPFWPLRRGASFDNSAAWSLHERLFRAAHDVTAKAGAKFLAAFIPAGSQVNGYEWDTGRILHDFRTGETAPYEMEKRLIALAGRDHIPVVDLLPPFQHASTTSRRIYFHYDGHLTPYGHEVAATALEGPLRALIAGQ